MKVILSVEPIRYPVTGIGRYTLELARNLVKLPEISELRYYGDTDFVPELPVPRAGPPAASVSMIKTAKRFLARNPLLLDLHRKLVARRRERSLRGTEDWIYHGPNFYLPPVKGRAVVTIHDLSVFTMPECHPAERVSFMRKEIELSLKRASVLITDSEFTRNEVATYFSWPLEKVRTARLASSGDFGPLAAQAVTPALHAYGLKPGAYALYAGTIEPRKNLGRLIEAYAGLPSDLRKQFPLVLAGYKGWNNEEIMRAVRRGEGEGWLKYLGYVPDEVLPQLFAGAKLFVFPSLYEGFGLPVLEAMSSGVPVVCSDTSSLPEVVGDAAAMCAPHDVEGLKRLIERGLQDETWRSQAIERGFAQAKKFSWRHCAQETVAAYGVALDRAA